MQTPSRWWFIKDGEPREIPLEEIVGMLERQFTHASFLQSSRKWKLVAVEDAAKQIKIMLDTQRQAYQQLLADSVPTKPKADYIDPEFEYDDIGDDKDRYGE